MRSFNDFSEEFYSEALSEELEIWFGNIEHEPENGIFYEFEWEALDSTGKDRKDDMPESEQAKVEQAIVNYLRHDYSKHYEDY
jgi:hypothetical protein